MGAATAWALIVGLVAGAFIGAAVMACCAMARCSECEEVRR